MTADTPYLLDTPTARTLLKAGVPATLRQRIRAARYGSVWMSAVTEGQLHLWVQQDPRERILNEALGLLLRNVPTVPFDRSAALSYAMLQKDPAGTAGISDADWMVAGHALSIEATLITADTRLRQIPHLKCENWLAA